MLISTILGNSDAIENEWEISKDHYGTVYIANDDIKQRIRLAKNVEEKLEKISSSANMVEYELPSSVVFSNSNRNMNLSIINFWSKDEKKREEHEDSNIAYVTLINENYKLISYELAEGVKIVQTYCRRDLLQGCALLFDGIDRDIIFLRCKDLKQNRFVDIVVAVDENGTPYTNKFVAEQGSDELKKIKSEFKYVSNKFIHFKMTCTPGQLPTSTFIVNGASEDLVKEVEDMTKAIKNAVILTLPAGNASFSDKCTEIEAAAVHDMFQQNLVDAKVRAITTVGIRLPRGFYKDYRILYHYDINPDSGEIRCIKSN